MFSHFSTRLMNKIHYRLLRASMGLLFPLLVCIMVVFGSSTAALAHPIPVGDGGSVVTPAQQCLEGTLSSPGHASEDPAHSMILSLFVTNTCDFSVRLNYFEIYSYSTCPATNVPPVSILSIGFPRHPTLYPGVTILDTDIHTSHCVICNGLYQPVGWPSFTVEVSLLDVYGTDEEGSDVYAAPHVTGTTTSFLSNGPVLGDARRCLGG